MILAALKPLVGNRFRKTLPWVNIEYFLGFSRIVTIQGFASSLAWLAFL